MFPCNFKELRSSARELAESLVSHAGSLENSGRETFGRLTSFRSFSSEHLAIRAMRSLLKPDSNCIDIGCCKGIFLNNMLRFAPHGRHFAVEPLAENFLYLKRQFGSYPNIELHQCALSLDSCTVPFFHTLDDPNLSGLRLPKIYRDKGRVELLKVQSRQLDEIIPAEQKIDLIKIDVEGAELEVILGGARIISKYKPVIIFEFNKPTANRFSVSCNEMYEILTDTFEFAVTTPRRWIHKAPPMSEKEFTAEFEYSRSPDFMAYPS